MKFFDIFLGLQGGLHDRVWHQMKSLNFYVLLFKKNRLILSDTVILTGKPLYV